MADQTKTHLSGLSQALGRIPSGLYILTASFGDRSTGLLSSWVQQAGFEPPMLTAAVQRNRHIVDWIHASGRFTLNQLAIGSKALIRHFSRGFEPDAPAFDGIPLLHKAKGGPVLASALAFLDTEVVAQLDEGDHLIFLARVVAGDVLHPGADPFIHVRSNGFHY
ncbi:MAG: flavin reductase family protein [Planctomycetaceae bacterium]|nr:flavin reductase family protein [Planctomycetaceae bacterium]MBV8318216.1 flavin reductase family protein [Planctomycetaceae bacterium]